MGELRLVLPTLEYGEQVMAFKQECLNIGSSMDGCGPLRRSNTAAEWLEDALSDTDPATLREGRVLATNFITVRQSDNTLVGMLQVRHYLNDYLEQFGGHIGDSIRPSERRKGYAKEVLRLMLAEAKRMKLYRVLLGAHDTNVGSCKTIEACGGVLENIVPDPEDETQLVKRYWIDIQPD